MSISATELAMTEWDDIESIITTDGKEYSGEFMLSKRGYVICTDDNDVDTNIPVSTIEYTNHR